MNVQPGLSILGEWREPNDGRALTPHFDAHLAPAT